MLDKPIQCIHLYPPLEDVPRWHCSVEDYEGDCPVYLKISDTCAFMEGKCENDKGGVTMKKDLVLMYGAILLFLVVFWGGVIVLVSKYC